MKDVVVDGVAFVDFMPQELGHHKYENKVPGILKKLELLKH